MITAEQLDYQAPPDADHSWVETYVLPVVVPDVPLYALIYVCIRPGLGVMANQVMITGALCESRAEQLHYSDNQHMPAPEKFSDWTSEIGLSVRVTDSPRNYRIDYEAADGTEIHVDWEGLMDPFDIHDPDHSPQAGRVEDMHADIETGRKHQAGHFDMTGRMTGTMKVRGEEYEVDGIERMDHSWGPRDPTVIKNMFIVSATFGEDLAFHMICPWNPEKTGTDAFQLTHGYVLQDGEVYGLTSEATISATMHGLICTGLDMTVKDTRGETFNLRATAGIGAPWYPYPSAISYNALMNWSYDDRTGYGVVFPNFNMTYLNQRYGRQPTDPSPAVLI